MSDFMPIAVKDKKHITCDDFPKNRDRILCREFDSCWNIYTIDIPKGFTCIESHAFYDCNGLERVTIPDSVTYIGRSAFEECIGLQTINIPSGVSSIKKRTFKNCTYTTTITIPESVTSIGALAFSGCKNLTSITIPESVTSIGESAFTDCDKLIVEFDWIEFNEKVFFNENISQFPRILTFRTLSGDSYKITVSPNVSKADFERVCLDLISKEMNEVVENLELHGLVVLYK